MKTSIKILIVLALIIITIGGYFLTRQLSSKRNVAYTQPSITLEEDTNNSNDAASLLQQAQQQAQSDDQQATTQQQSNVVDDTKSMQAPAQKQVKPNDIATKKVASNEKTNDEKSGDSKASANIVSKFVSWGFQKADSRNIKAVIIHTTYNALGGDPFDFAKVVQEWKDAGVSPHYAIDRDGTIYQLVADKNIAYHAGSSQLPDGTTDVNAVSIGIEMVNDKESKFTSAQYDALNKLLADLKNKYNIKYILGHDEIAPGRKTDPWGIEWNKVNR